MFIPVACQSPSASLRSAWPQLTLGFRTLVLPPTNGFYLATERIGSVLVSAPAFSVAACSHARKQSSFIPPSLPWTDSVCGACCTRRRTLASTTAATLRASSDCLPPRVGTTRVGSAVAKLPRFRLAPMSSLRRHVTCLTQSTGPGLRDERRLY